MFLFDECVDKGIVECLIDLYTRSNLVNQQKEGTNTLLVDHFQTFNKGTEDTEVLDYAYSNEFILVTEDKDFGELVYRLKFPHCGIVLIRIKDVPRIERIPHAASTIFEYRNELKNNFTVISNDGIKIKQQKNIKQ